MLSTFFNSLSSKPSDSSSMHTTPDKRFRPEEGTTSDRSISEKHLRSSGTKEENRRRDKGSSSNRVYPESPGFRDHSRYRDYDSRDDKKHDLSGYRDDSRDDQKKHSISDARSKDETKEIQHRDNESRSQLRQSPVEIPDSPSDIDARMPDIHDLVDKRVTDDRMVVDSDATAHHQSKTSTGHHREREHRVKQSSQTQEVQRLQGYTQSLEHQLREAHRGIQARENHIRDLQHRLSNAQNEIQHYRAQEIHSQELLDARRRELQGAQTFLNTTDSYSGADIIEMVRTLNSEILQAAAFVTDTIEAFPPEPLEARVGRDEFREARKAAVDLLGKEATRFLSQDVAEEEAVMVVQVALQAGLCHLSRSVLNLWANSKSFSDGLDKVYAGIREQQGQAQVVAGTWRSLTRTRTKRPMYEKEKSGWRDSMVESVKAILVVAGWWPNDAEAVHSLIRERISAIFSLLPRLDEAMNERITSTQMALCVPRSGVNFDVETMENEDGEESSSGVVLFVSDMGLKKIDRDVSSGKDLDTILLKPKVLLREAFMAQSEGASQRAEVKEGQASPSKERYRS
ncbi:hypothetical protein BT96DRAFT_977052 [Gymnopus androsaceus JB14]|uniref:Uncharacterized protein n=1 Tax=Gymnopus androsaceus JB14 TaxID=1447944 RepID=A0A6A4HJY3_9AGAR|nr:hypothetical protein BT96DRAFT_977052 [Gymnopus androsaceus JB14]